MEPKQENVKESNRVDIKGRGPSLWATFTAGVAVALGGVGIYSLRTSPKNERSPESLVGSVPSTSTNDFSHLCAPIMSSDAGLEWGRLVGDQRAAQGRESHERYAQEVARSIQRDGYLADTWATQMMAAATRPSAGEGLSDSLSRLGNGAQIAQATGTVAIQDTLKQIGVQNERGLVRAMEVTAQTPEERVAIASMITSATTGVPMAPPSSGQSKDKQSPQETPPPALNAPQLPAAQRDGGVRERVIQVPAKRSTFSPSPPPSSEGRSSTFGGSAIDTLSPIAKRVPGIIALKAGEKIVNHEAERHPDLNATLKKGTAWGDYIFDSLLCPAPIPTYFTGNEKIDAENFRIAQNQMQQNKECRDFAAYKRDQELRKIEQERDAAQKKLDREKADFLKNQGQTQRQ